jgi:hypothetical protein
MAKFEVTVTAPAREMRNALESELRDWTHARQAACEVFRQVSMPTTGSNHAFVATVSQDTELESLSVSVRAVVPLSVVDEGNREVVNADELEVA